MSATVQKVKLAQVGKKGVPIKLALSGAVTRCTLTPAVTVKELKRLKASTKTKFTSTEITVRGVSAEAAVRLPKGLIGKLAKAKKLTLAIAVDCRSATGSAKTVVTTTVKK